MYSKDDGEGVSMQMRRRLLNNEDGAHIRWGTKMREEKISVPLTPKSIYHQKIIKLMSYIV